jgi:hypothetical protein
MRFFGVVDVFPVFLVNNVLLSHPFFDGETLSAALR